MELKRFFQFDLCTEGIFFFFIYTEPGKRSSRRVVELRLIKRSSVQISAAFFKRTSSLIEKKKKKKHADGTEAVFLKTRLQSQVAKRSLSREKRGSDLVYSRVLKNPAVGPGVEPRS